MTITLKATGVSDVILCDGAEYAGTAGKFIGPLGEGTSDTTWQVQFATPLRAPAQTPFDRLNAAHAFNFQVLVEFASEDLATAFRLGWAASLPRTGAYLVVRHTASLSQTFTPAVLQHIRITQTGLSCLVDYQFQTGAPSTGA